MVSILFVTSLCFNVTAETEDPSQNVQQFTVTIGEGTETDLGFITTTLEGESTVWSKQVTVNPGSNVYLKVEPQEGKTFGKWTVTGG